MTSYSSNYTNWEGQKPSSLERSAGLPDASPMSGSAAREPRASGEDIGGARFAPGTIVLLSCVLLNALIVGSRC